jgi:hypothetical protein
MVMKHAIVVWVSTFLLRTFLSSQTSFPLHSLPVYSLRLLLPEEL